ncbi:probable Na(+)/H(+) antiporter nhx-9 isoform X2 [Artemia franciscana]|uniref:probable Na(+)/H(+) antiporter nhx-9 isoform X2 n=1 Tax=Artemia franciscana TaxID=6661 RepID=UPI0032D9F772
MVSKPTLLLFLTLFLAAPIYCEVEHDYLPGHPPDHLLRTADLPSDHFLGGDLDNKPHSSEEGHESGHHGFEIAHVDFTRVEGPFVISLWIFCASLAKIGFHMAPKLSNVFPESCLLIVVGVAIGLLLFHTSSVSVSPLTPTVFFIYMLPPIILDAGYFMPNRLFFDNLGTILLFAVIGTIWNVVTIGLSLYGCGLTGIYGFELPILDAFLFGSLISAVDPVAVLAVFEEVHVNEVLYIVVFGESLLNDAVTVVLYNMFDSYTAMGIENIKYTDLLAGVASFFVVAIGGTIIGIIWGFLTAFVTRFTNHVRVIEPVFIFVMSYLAYLNAEIFHLSGILAITFCGITMKNYVETNISQKSHTTIKYAMKMLSSSSETVIFMFLGVSTVHDQHAWNTAFILLTILFCSVYRAVGVIIFTELANHFRIHKLSGVEKFVMSYGGLRGAVAFALVLLINKKIVPLQPLFVTATMSMVYFTVFFQGITIKPLVNILKVKRAVKRDLSMNQRIHEKTLDHLMAGIEDVLGRMGNNQIRNRFKHFDNKYVRPCLVRDYKVQNPKILETFTKLTMKDAVELTKKNRTVPSFNSFFVANDSGSILARDATNATSFTHIDANGQWNIDLGEIEYCPSTRDLTDAKIHHLLSEELGRSHHRGSRRLSYSRHTLDDREFLNAEVNHSQRHHVRRMMGDTVRKQAQRNSRKKDDKKRDELTQNGSSKKLHDDYVHQVIQETEGRKKEGENNEDLDGITFTARGKRMSDVEEIDPEIATPTATETQLPWKRTEDDGPVKQQEFPTWITNKDYTAYNSPTTTFLGSIKTSMEPTPSVINLFKSEGDDVKTTSISIPEDEDKDAKP